MCKYFEIAKYVSQSLKEKGFEYVTEISNESQACRKNGTSFYVYARYCGNAYKFRISDHDCGQYRFDTEVQISSMEQAEMAIFPERFEEVVTSEIREVKFSENPESSAPVAKEWQKVEKEDQIGTTKKGLPIFRYKITIFKISTVKI